MTWNLVSYTPSGLTDRLVYAFAYSCGALPPLRLFPGGVHRHDMKPTVITPQRNVPFEIGWRESIHRGLKPYSGNYYDIWGGMWWVVGFVVELRYYDILRVAVVNQGFSYCTNLSISHTLLQGLSANRTTNLKEWRCASKKNTNSYDADTSPY